MIVMSMTIDQILDVGKTKAERFDVALDLRNSLDEPAVEQNVKGRCVACGTEGIPRERLPAWPLEESS